MGEGGRRRGCGRVDRCRGGVQPGFPPSLVRGQQLHPISYLHLHLAGGSAACHVVQPGNQLLF